MTPLEIELLSACKRCLPEWTPREDEHDNHICCEITNGDVRALQAAIAHAESQQMIGHKGDVMSRAPFMTMGEVIAKSSGRPNPAE